MANVKIKLGYKNSAWFTANATLVLDEGQVVFLSGSSVKFKRGDGVTVLSVLEFNFDEDATLDAYVVGDNTPVDNTQSLLEAIQNLQGQIDYLKANTQGI